MSGFISGLSFKERAALVKECYETLKTIYQKSIRTDSNEKSLIRDYEQIVGLCENHSENDYCLALCIEHISSSEESNSETKIKANLDRRPNRYHWFRTVFFVSKRTIMFCLLYFIPIILFFALEQWF